MRQGWYALPDAPPEIVAAVRVGGALTSVSAARHYGLWALDDARLHVAVPRNASRLRSPRSPLVRLADAEPHDVCLHWRRPSHTMPIAVAPMVAALLHVIDCQAQERAVAIIDSALNGARVLPEQLRAAAQPLASRYLQTLDQCDPASQSGTETLVRLRLRRLGIGLRSQVQIRGVGRVDLLVGDRLVIECDSHEFHDGAVASQRDYDRDLALVAMDYLVLRLNYRQIVHEWDRVEHVILGLIARRRHLRPAPLPR
ncbi:MAG: DUF559 domain-containing protein [Microbacteriaceae bacterium]